jgi:aminopeptidase YwaD
MSDTNLVPEIGPQQVKEAFAFTDEIVEGYPGRLAGSVSCQKAAQRIKAEFEKFCDAATVKDDQCDIHPQSLVKFVPVVAALYFVSMFLLYFVPSLAWVSFTVLALSQFAYYVQIGMHRHLLDPLFPRKDGYNVYGSIEPSGQVKQQIILSGHHDAAYVFHVRERLPKLYAPLRKAGSFLLVIAVLVSLAAAILPYFGIAFPQLVALVFLILGILIIPFFFLTTSQASPGAGDDMMAVSIAAGAGKLFSDAKKAGNNPLEHTRLIILSVDAEECGLRGSHAWVKRHLAELKATKTFVFNMDPIYKFKYIEFYDHDLSSEVKLSREMAQECVDIAAGLGFKAYIAPPRKGAATDAANYGLAGIEAIDLHAMSSKESDLAGWVYHTRNDVSKYIEPEVVEAVLKIIRGYVLKKDAGV